MSSLISWLEHLETTPHYLTTPAPERIKEILQHLNFHKDFFIITIAGTNGKGTTTHLLSNYLQKQGLKVGRFTSPHLLKFNERIAIDDLPASDAEIIAAFEIIKAAQKDVALTYFDYSFLASLLIFKKHKINLACLEVGLGGRLDATNALDTDCAVITTIDLDHQAQLGESRAQIAWEKAQIMRPHTLCICGDLDAPATIKEYAQKINAQFYLRNDNFTVVNDANFWQLKAANFNSEPLPYPQHIPAQNAVTALMVILQISPKLNLTINIKLFKELLLRLQVPGRMQILQNQPKIILDVAHNPESARYLTQQLQQHPGKTYALFSALNDKDLAAIVAPLQPIIDTWYIFELNHPRAATIQQLQAAILTTNPKAKVHTLSTPQTSYQQIKAKLNTQDQLIIFGSFAIIQNLKP